MGWTVLDVDDSEEDLLSENGAEIFDLVMRPELDDLFIDKKVNKPMKRKFRFPRTQEEIMNSQFPWKLADDSEKPIFEYMSPEAIRLLDLEHEEEARLRRVEVAEMVSVEGVMPRLEKKKFEIKRRSELNDGATPSFEPPIRTPTPHFGYTDVRLRNQNPTPPSTDNNQRNEAKKNFLANSIALMARDVRVPDKTPDKTVRRSPRKSLTPLDKALRQGLVPVLTLDPRKPKSDINPKISICKNGPKQGGKFSHGDFNKPAKTVKNSEMMTEPVKARHVGICTAVRVGPTILDPNGYIKDEFAAYQKVPKLEAELESERLQRNAVQSQFIELRERLSELDLVVMGARREREDAVEAEKEALKREKAALELVEFWKGKATAQRTAKNKMKEALKAEVVLKVIRAIDRVNEMEGMDEEENEKAKVKVAENVSKDTAEPGSDWSNGDETF